jgi:hypothetical protein
VGSDRSALLTEGLGDERNMTGSFERKRLR